MEKLKRSIRELRVSNYESKKFVPHGSLRKLMTEVAVTGALENSNIGGQNLPETVKAIVPGGCKIFAILVLDDNWKYFTRFIQDDQLQDWDLDHRLPFTLLQLRKILPQEDADLFEEKQWEFAAPEFSGKVNLRYLDKQTILPFTNDKKIGSGGFGEVYHIEIHNEYNRFEPSAQRAVYHPRCFSK